MMPTPHHPHAAPTALRNVDREPLAARAAEARLRAREARGAGERRVHSAGRVGPALDAEAPHVVCASLHTHSRTAVVRDHLAPYALQAARAADEAEAIASAGLVRRQTRVGGGPLALCRTRDLHCPSHTQPTPTTLARVRDAPRPVCVAHATHRPAHARTAAQHTRRRHVRLGPHALLRTRRNRHYASQHRRSPTAVRDVHVGPHAVLVAVARHRALEVLAAADVHVLQTARHGEPAHGGTEDALCASAHAADTYHSRACPPRSTRRPAGSGGTGTHGSRPRSSCAASRARASRASRRRCCSPARSTPRSRCPATRPRSCTCGGSRRTRRRDTVRESPVPPACGSTRPAARSTPVLHLTASLRAYCTASCSPRPTRPTGRSSA